MITMACVCHNCGALFQHQRYRRFCADCDPEYAPGIFVIALMLLSAWGWWAVLRWAWGLL